MINYSLYIFKLAGFMAAKKKIKIKKVVTDANLGTYI